MADPSPSFVRVEDIAELLSDAVGLVRWFYGAKPNAMTIMPDEARDWLARCSKFAAQLQGNRDALRELVVEILNRVATDASSLDDVNEQVLSDNADTIMRAVDDYGDSLPFMRHATRLELDESDPAEALAKAIYEVSCEISGNPDLWERVPAQIADTLRLTSRELIAAGVIVMPEVFGDPEENQERDRILRRFSSPPMTDQEALTIRREMERTRDLLAGEDVHQIGCDRPDPHDGHVVGECMRGGVTIRPDLGWTFLPDGTKLPPNIPMPPGFEATGGGDDPH